MATASDGPRIVSLIPSATEIVSALGFGGNLVGRSHECDFPPEVETLPAVSESKFVSSGTSREVDASLRAVVSEGLSVYRVDPEKLAAMAPDVIVTQAHCEVCAVSLADVEAAVCEMVASRPKIVSLEPVSLKEVWAGMVEVAAALGARQQGEELAASLQGRMDGIRMKAGKFARSRPKVLGIEWIEPLMAGGNWMPELMAMAGADELFATAGAKSPWIEWDDVRAAAPDVVLVKPCGFDLARTLGEMRALTALDGWQELPAVKAGRVFVCDGHNYFNRPGPRLVETLEILDEMLHPDLFDFSHEGSGWVRFDGSPEAAKMPAA